MRLSNEISTLFFKTLKTSRKVSRLSVSTEDIHNYCYTINEINAIEKDEHCVGDYLLANYMIPECLSALIVPCEIKFSTDTWATDFKSGEYKKANSITEMVDEDNKTLKPRLLSPQDFSMIGQAICGAVRKSAEGSAEKPVSGLILAKTLNDVHEVAKLDSEDKLLATDAPYVPREITIKLYKDFKYSATVDDIIPEWFRQALK